MEQSSISLDDALDILNLRNNPTITPETVRMHCKKLLLRYHPDKPGGDRHKFEVVHAAAKLILKTLRQQANTHAEFKAAYKAHAATEFEVEAKPAGGKVSKEKFAAAWAEAEKAGAITRRKGYSNVDADFTAENSGKQLIVRIEPDPIWDGIDDLIFDAPTLAGDDEIASKPAVPINQTTGCDYHTAYATDRSIDKIRATRTESSIKNMESYKQQRERQAELDLTAEEKRKIADHAKYMEKLEKERIRRQIAIDQERERVYNLMNNLLQN